MSGAEEGAELRLVTPGEAIGASSGKRAGTGTLVMGDNIIATKVGWVKENNGVTSVDPIASAYMPRSGDLVIGIVESVRNNLWFADVNGPFNGLLPMSLAPWKVEFGAARQHMDIGDIMLARVQEVDEAHNIVLTMKGVGLRRLKEGIMADISMNHISRLRGDNDSTLRELKEVSDCRIIVAENGRVWIDGDSDGISFMRTVLELVRNDGHKATFSESLDSLIQKRRNA
jgi:exosome complex component RRP4